MSVEKWLWALLFVLLVPVVVWLIRITGSNPDLAQAYATILSVLFSSVFIAILVGDRLADKPKLKLKMEGKTEISDYKYALKISVSNRGRKDAYNCRVSVQVFNQKSRKKIGEYHSAESDLKPGETKPFHISGVLAFNGNFVARISAETHKSKANKIVEYKIRNNYDPIIFKWGFIQSLRSNLYHPVSVIWNFFGDVCDLHKHSPKTFLSFITIHTCSRSYKKLMRSSIKRLFKKYQNDWDTEFLANGLTIFSDQNIRKELIEKLGEMGDDKVVDPLIHCLKNDLSDIVRDSAAKVLGNIGDKRAVDPLLGCLQEPNVDLKWGASAIVKICNQKCDQESVNKLSDILDHDNIPPYTRGVIAESLGEIREELRTENIEGALIDALEDLDGDDLCSVVKALGKVGGEKALKQLENIKDCSNIRKKAIEQIRFRIYIGGDNIEDEY